MPAKPRVFLSYARSDGEVFARSLRERLERDEPEITLWQDRTQMEGGVGWWKQITDALDVVRFMVLVMTPASLDSPLVRKEWRYARQQGICVYPVKGEPDERLDFASLPQWMQKAHFFDLDHEWQTFVQHLKGPGQATRVPFMAPEPPEGFVERPREFGQLLGYLLDAGRENPVAITTALHGAGGFGKTTLAAALCHNDDVLTAFDDGILWVTLGEKPNVLEGLVKLYAALTGERPGFVDTEDAAFHLSEKIKDKNCLLVIDDVWDAAHVRPFLRGGKDGCARLITTRNFTVAAEAHRVNVDEMTPTEAVRLLTARLPCPPAPLQPFGDLARRLGEWPLLLELANATLRQRLARGDSLPGALDYLNHRLDKKGVQAFDQNNAVARNQAIARTIAVSMEMLTAEEHGRYTALAIFPEDTNIPLAEVGRLLGLDEFDTEEFIQHLADLSLVQFDLKVGTVRLHDMTRAYLGDQLATSVALHARLIDAWGNVYALPGAYAWRRLSYHLVEAGRREVLLELLWDFDWLLAKLTATDVPSLIGDYAYLTDQVNLQLVRKALQLSAHILSRDKAQLPSQLLGRLLCHQGERLQALLTRAKEGKAGLWLRPLTPSLTPPGGPLLRTLIGHGGWVQAVALTPDGQWVVSASDDGSLKVWDLDTGAELRTLSSPTSPVNAVAVMPDGRRAVSGSEDGTLRIWNLEEGIQQRTLACHAGPVYSVALTPDGQRAISTSRDRNLKVWDLSRGTELLTLTGHTDWVRGVTVSSDGRVAVSASEDRTLRVWNLASGCALHTLTGHQGWVDGVAVTGDGQRAVSASADGTLRVWDVNNRTTLHTLADHSGPVSAVAVTPDGRRAVSASRDKTLAVWDLDEGVKLQTLEGHTGWVLAVAVTPDGRRAVSASRDQTLKVWNLESSGESPILSGHKDQVRALTVTDDGRRVVSASWDGTLKVWDLETGMDLHTLVGHTDAIGDVAVTHDGRRAVSASWDKTVRIWDLEKGAALHTLRGHKGPVRAVVVTPDDQHIVSAAEDGTLKVWDLETGARLRTLVGHSDWVLAVVVTPAGRHVISAGEDATLRVWRLNGVSELFTLAGHTERVRGLALTPGGWHVISASWDKTLKVWDLQHGTELFTLIGHTGPVHAVAVTPDGRRVVSAAEDGSLKVWNLATGTELHTLANQNELIYAVAVLPDSYRAVSVAVNGHLQIWDLENGAEITCFRGDGRLSSCVVAPDGRTIVAGETSGRVHFLRLEGA
jgi:WD40 repeat protein